MSDEYTSDSLREDQAQLGMVEKDRLSDRSTLRVQDFDGIAPKVGTYKIGSGRSSIEVFVSNN